MTGPRVAGSDAPHWSGYGLMPCWSGYVVSSTRPGYRAFSRSLSIFVSSRVPEGGEDTMGFLPREVGDNRSGFWDVGESCRPGIGIALRGGDVGMPVRASNFAWRVCCDTWSELSWARI